MNMRFFLPVLTLTATLGVGSLSVATAFQNAGDHHGPTNAVCVLRDVAGSDVNGVIHFAKHGKNVVVTGVVKGLSPGKHGFHVHQFGDVTGDADGKSTGGHFNPHHTAHGRPGDKIRHVGDLGNIVANADGVAKFKKTDGVIALSGENSIVGRSIVIHAKADDFGQPTGNAGARVAYGVIGIAKAPE